MDDNPPDLMATIKLLSQALGYRFEHDADGTERVYRPDGTLAVMAKPTPPIHPIIHGKRSDE